jgi:CheY-like chemotaxis protein
MEGCVSVEVTDGREAYRLLKSDSDFRAAVVDMVMPELQGLDLIRYMRTEKRLMRIPVLMITAQQDLKLMKNCFEAGVTMFLTKPFRPETLQSSLRILLSGKQTSFVPLNATAKSSAVHS